MFLLIPPREHNDFFSFKTNTRLTDFGGLLLSRDHQRDDSS